MWIRPKDVNYSKWRWVETLREGKENEMAVVVGEWSGDGEQGRRVGLRWNGDATAPEGWPYLWQGRRKIPVWLVIEKGPLEVAVRVAAAILGAGSRRHEA